MANLLGEGAGKLTAAMRRELEQSRLFDEAMRLVEEQFGKYAGARPDVPQEVFPRSPIGKQKIDPVVAKAISDKDVLAQMMAGMERGRHLAGWYNMEPLRLKWNEISGSDVGTHRFNRFQDYMGPTSILSKVDPNIGNASRWTSYDINRKVPPERLNNQGNKLIVPPPAGYGGPGQINQYKVAMPMLESGQPLDPFDYLKTSRYSGALKGNWANLPVDRHAVRGPLMLLGDPEGLATSVKLGKGIPTFNAQQRFGEPGMTYDDIKDVPVTWWKDVPKNAAEYYAMEDYYKMLANEAGLSPAEGQAATWVGNAGMTGVETDPTLTGMDLFKRRVAGQAVQRERDPRDILTDFMTGAGHLGVAGAGLGLGSSLLPGGENR
jgi:hypothetical protein